MPFKMLLRRICYLQKYMQMSPTMATVTKQRMTDTTTMSMDIPAKDIHISKLYRYLIFKSTATSPFFTYPTV